MNEPVRIEGEPGEAVLPAGSPLPAAAELAALETLEPDPALRRGPGRVTFRWRRPGGPEAIVKRYEGAPPRERLRARLAGEAPRSPGRVEHDNLVALRALGLAVPEPWGVHERGPLSLVVMEAVEHAEDLRRRLVRRPEDAQRFFEPLFELVDRLHGAGWYHRDLYLDHFLPRAGGEGLVLIDVGRARRDRRPRRRWFVKDLAALLHSTPEALRGPRTLRFLARWLDRRGLGGRRERRRWARAILAKERRMAAHVPRGGESFPEVEA